MQQSKHEKLPVEEKNITFVSTQMKETLICSLAIIEQRNIKYVYKEYHFVDIVRRDKL